MITGASGSLGTAISKAFWKSGASLLLTGRNRAALERLQSELIVSPGVKQWVKTFPANLNEASEIDRLITEFAAECEGVAVLVNNAAAQGPIGNLWKTDVKLWEQTLHLNLTVPFRLCAGIIPFMLKSHYGKIINISGGGATSSRPRFSAYAASKAALVRLTETLADETKGLGIHVNAIAPGIMNTRMTEEVLQSGPELAGLMEFQKAKAQQAASDTTTPRKAADLSVFLASAESDGITGRLISAVWDPWRELRKRWVEIEPTDIYTLRRITPKDRGKNWEQP